MANYQGLYCIMPEITMMAADARPPHDQHIYDYFVATEKFVRIAVPQLVADYLGQFEEQLVVEFETYLNGQRIHHDDIERAVADIVKKSVGKALKGIKITL